MLGVFFIKCLVFSKSILNFLSLYERVDNSLYNLYKKKCYKERIKFLTKCRFHRVVPNHLEFINKNIKRNYMFSKKCKIKQNRMIETLISKLFNIEITDLHTRLINT